MIYCLENEHLKLEFDKKTGAIIGLLSKITGWQIIRQPKLAMGIRLLVPIENHRNNKVLSQEQVLSSMKIISNEEAVLKWERVIGDKSGSLDIAVELRVILREANISFHLNIKNISPYVVEEVWCPCIGGLREPANETILQSMSMHMWAGANFTPLGDGFPQACGYWGVDNPTIIKTFPEFNNQTPFVILSNGKQGMYLGMHDEELNIVNFVHELKPGYLDSKNQRVPQEDEIDGIPAGFVISAARLPFIQPGEKMKFAPIILSLFEGTWHDGIKKYLEWRNQWFHQRVQPAWLGDIDCWMTLQINSPEGCCQHRYTELPEIVREAKEKGVQLLQLIGWARDGQDGAEPYQDIDPLLGTFDELKQAIEEIEEMGVIVLLMCKFKWVDHSIPEFKEEMHQHTLKDMYGNYVQFNGYSYQTLAQQLNGGSRRSGAGMCHLSEGYRKLALREFYKILELGSSGILYDELSNNMLLCFDSSHGHRLGDSHYKGSIKLAEEFYQAAKERNSEFLLAGEGTIDPMSQFYPVNYVRTWNNAWMGDGEHTPAWKYMNPDMKIVTCLTGWDDRETVHQALTYGYIINYEPYNFKGRIRDIPRTVAYGQKAQTLRRKLWDYIWNGKFSHIVGAKVDTQNDNFEFIYSVFENKSNGKRAVVLANQSGKKELKAVVKLDSGVKTFELYNIENDNVIKCEGSLNLEPRSIVILVEK